MPATMTRRERQAETTRHDILAAGREIFSRYPYFAVSGLEICNHAGVTRGALQHHFGSKLGLFTAVFESLQQEVYTRITEAACRHQDPWEQVRAGIAAFLDACTERPYQTIVLKDGPAAMGWDRWRELDTKYYAHMVPAFIEVLAPAGLGDYASAMLTATMRGTLTELSFAIARSDDPARAREEALAVVDRLLSSFRGTPPNSATREPIRISIGQLRSNPGGYLERAVAGETFHVIRRGRVVARLLP